MPVQISITRHGKAMTLQCVDDEWERIRKRFNEDSESDDVMWVEGTDGERMGLRVSDIFNVIYIDEETFEQMKRDAQVRQARRRGMEIERGGAH